MGLYSDKMKTRTIRVKPGASACPFTVNEVSGEGSAQACSWEGDKANAVSCAGIRALNWGLA